MSKKLQSKHARFLAFAKGQAWLEDTRRRAGLTTYRRYGRAFYRAIGFLSRKSL
jgi:hypothetical protein